MLRGKGGGSFTFDFIWFFVFRGYFVRESERVYGAGGRGFLYSCCRIECSEVDSIVWSLI